MYGRLVSDDTILHLAVADGLTTDYKNNDDLVKNIANKMIEYYDKDKKKQKRLYGNRTIKGLERLKENYDRSRKYNFSNDAGGSGCSMRCMCIGMAFYGKRNREKLIEISIESSRCTHNNPIGYLGGLVSALFVAYGFEEVEPEMWIFELLKLLKSDLFNNIFKRLIEKYHPLDKLEMDKHLKEKEKFIDIWEDYKDWRYRGIGRVSVKENKSLIYPHIRIKNYWNRFSIDKSRFFPGSSGVDSVIIAYDCLLDAGKNFDQIIFYGCLNSGDSDTIGSICAAWYGSIYSFGNSTLTFADNLEKTDEIDKIAVKMIKKYIK